MRTNKIYPFWFLLAPLALYIIFFLMPSVIGLVYSFTDWNVRSINEAHFIGLENFKTIFSDTQGYVTGILNTLKFTLISNVIKLAGAFFLALLLHEKLKGKGFYRTVFYMPSILPFMIIGIIFTSIFDFRNGLLNVALSSLGLDFLKQKWLSDLNVVWKSIYLVDAWRGIGYVMTIFLAGLAAIPKTYYEAAQIDGIGFFGRLWYITLPMLSGSIMINLVFGITYGLKVFDIVYVLTNGGPGHATEVLTTYTYKAYATGYYGLSVAMNSILFLIALAIGLVVIQVMSRKEVQQ